MSGAGRHFLASTAQRSTASIARPGSVHGVTKSTSTIAEDADATTMDGFQAALHGFLAAIRDLGLSIIALETVAISAPCP